MVVLTLLALWLRVLLVPDFQLLSPYPHVNSITLESLKKASQKNRLSFFEIVLQGSNDNPLERYEPCRWKILPDVFLGILSAKST